MAVSKNAKNKYKLIDQAFVSIVDAIVCNVFKEVIFFLSFVF